MNPSGKSPSPRHHQRHAGHRSATSGSGNTSSRSNASKYIRDCACGQGLACVGMTQAFRLLGDPRCYYVELPRFRVDPPAYKYVFRNNLRAAYLRHLHSLNPNLDLPALEHSQDRRYVALHHFHPAVVKAFYDNPLTSGAARKHKVPISITEHELQELNMDIQQNDRILSVTGAPTGGYYFCPSYAQERSHEDLKQLIKRERAIREEKERKQKLAVEAVVPENIEIDKQVTPSPATPVTDPVTALQEVQLTSNSEVIEKLVKPHSEDLVETPEETTSEENDIRQPEEGKTTVLDDDSITEKIQDSTHIDTEVFEGREVQDDEDEEEEFKAVISENRASEFDSLWAEEDQGGAGGDCSGNDGDEVVEEENMNGGESSVLDRMRTADAFGTDEVHEEQEAAFVLEVPPLKTKSPGRETDHPWETPKYRRHLERPETTKRASSTPAHFIDPNAISMSTRDLVGSQDSGDDAGGDGTSDGEIPPQPLAPAVKATPSETATAAQKSAASISAAALLALKSIDEAEETPKESSLEPMSDLKSGEEKKDPPGWSTVENKKAAMEHPRIYRKLDENRSFEDNRSHASDDSFGTGTITLKHNYPGADPTLRIQVHNDLIAWESKRRTDKSELLDYHEEKWQAIRSLLQEGLEEVEFAERFVSGFAKAGVIFADSTRAVCDDKMLDDSGNTVSNSFLQNRLYKKRNAQTQEYSIDSQDQSTESGQSALLNSILEAQLELANNFRDCSSHVENEILPELRELRGEIQAEVKELATLGDSIVGELKRSEIELKNIWDVFDAMVTGDLMEYTVHGSMHGGSQHGGSMHSSFGPSTGSMQSFLSPRGEGEGPIVSSVHSPMVKSTFRQLGAVEDGWLVEMYYRSAVAYQQAVFGIAENELGNLAKRTTSLEEQRFRRLHQLLLSFVPRQRRLFKALPENLKGVLDDLVGLRIDEDTLQTIIDESIRDRSHDHLKRGASHRSSIMNRSRIKKANEAEETEIEKIESTFGDPFKSSIVLLSKVVELQPGGIRSMVNTSWSAALVVVTAEGNMHVFILPEEISGTGQSPSEAFKALCPAVDFDTAPKWSRKQEIAKPLTPTMTLSMKHSTFSVPTMHNRHLQVVEDKPQGGSGSNNSTGRNRFMKAMKAAADSQRSRKCTLRLSSAAEIKEWVNLLERTKKVLTSKESSSKPSRFGF